MNRLAVSFVKRWLGLMLLVFTPSALLAQGVTTASISGTVMNMFGVPLGGANITVLHEPSGTRYATPTRGDGRFNLRDLRIGGPYTITASSIGLTSKVQKNVNLSLGQDLQINFDLEDKTLDYEEITVVGDKNKIMNSDRTGAATSINTELLQEMPTISRSAQDFTRLTPQSSGNSFGGRNNYYNNFSLDGSIFNNSFGLDVPTPGGQTNAQPVSLDAIEQIQVTIAPYDVRQGGFTGAGINTVTRSGTNEMSGSIYTFTRNENFIGDQVGEATVNNPDLSYNQSGFRLGGPLAKNKIFFFLNGEIERREEPATTILAGRSGLSGPNVSRVSAADLEAVSDRLRDVYGYETGAFENYNHLTENDKVLLKLNWHLNDSHEITFRYNYLRSWRDVLPHPAISAGGRGPNVNSMPFENTSYVINNNLDSFVGELSSRLSNKLANRFRFSYTRFRDFRESKSDPFPSIDINKNGITYMSFGLERFSTHNILDQDVFEITDDISFYKGKNTFTFGSSLEIFQFNNSFNLFYYPGYTFESVEAFLAATTPNSPTFIDFNAAVAQSQQREYKMDAVDVGQLAFYGQDKMQVNKNLVATLGLRVDMPLYFTDPDENPTIESKVFRDENGDPATFDVGKLPDSKLLFSPRVGFNWDARGDKTLQVRGGTGIFTGRLRFVWISNQISNGAINPFYTFQINGSADDFKWPQVWRTNLGVDKQLPWDMMGTLELIYNKDINAVVHRNYNMAPPTGRANGADNRPIFNPGEERIYPVLPADGMPDNLSFIDAGAILLDNTDEGHQYTITGQLEKTFPNGLMTRLAYTYSEAKDLTSTPGEIAADAFQLNPVVGNPNQPELSYSDFGLRHRLIGVLSYSKAYSKRFNTTFSLFMEMGRGDRFSYVYAGDMNRDGIPQNNDLMYVPADASEINLVPVNAADIRPPSEIWQQLDDYISQDDYLSSRRGDYAERNGALGEWFSQFDVRVMQDVKLNWSGQQHTFQISLDVLNLGNMLSSDWGVRQVPANKSPLTFMGYNTEGEPVFSFPKLEETFVDDTGLNSRWKAQLGLRYIFN